MKFRLAIAALFVFGCTGSSGQHRSDGAEDSGQSQDARPEPEAGEVDAILPDTGTNSKDVYVAGFVKFALWESPAYWVNGMRVDLPAPNNWPSVATSIAVSGEDVHVSGYYSYKRSDGKIFKLPCYWVNGTRRDLPVTDTVPYPSGEGSFVFISGGDVYIAGYTHDGGCYWRNGDRTDLTLEGAGAAKGMIPVSIYVQDADIHVAGHIYFESTSDDAAYWKNGKVEQLYELEESKDSYATSVYISEDGDAYVSGNTPDEFNLSRPCYWFKQNMTGATWVRHGLQSDSSAYVHSIVESDDDVYAAGFTFLKAAWTDETYSVPCYWKGRQLNLLENSLSSRGSAYSIAVSGSSIYVAGYVHVESKKMPCYWKDGTRVDLPIGKNGILGEATSIYISD